LRAGSHYCSLDLEFGVSCCEMPESRNPSTATGKSTSPGGDSTGAGAERESGFDPQSKAELAQGECKGAREVLVLARHVHTAHSRGVARGGAKDPTDDPAELDVLF
jgi:hypothetical protein